MRTEKPNEKRSKLKRSIEIDGETWEWQVSKGAGGGVVFRSPSGNVSKVDMVSFTGMSKAKVAKIWDDWEEDIAVTPGDVKEYIEKHMEDLK